MSEKHSGCCRFFCIRLHQIQYFKMYFCFLLMFTSGEDSVVCVWVLLAVSVNTHMLFNKMTTRWGEIWTHHSLSLFLSWSDSTGFLPLIAHRQQQTGGTGKPGVTRTEKRDVRLRSNSVPLAVYDQPRKLEKSRTLLEEVMFMETVDFLSFFLQPTEKIWTSEGWKLYFRLLWRNKKTVKTWPRTFAQCCIL